MKTENKVYLGLIFVILTLLTAFLTKWGFLTYEDLKFAAGFVLALMGYFYKSFESSENKREAKRAKIENVLLKNRIEIIEKRK